MKKFIFILLISSSIFAGMNEKGKIDLSVYDNIKLSSLLKFMADGVSKQIPIQIDNITTLTRVFSYKNKIVYIKEIETFKSKDIQELLKTSEGTYSLKREAYKQDRNIVCNERILFYLLKTKGAIVEYRWQNEKVKQLFDYTVEYKDCK